MPLSWSPIHFNVFCWVLKYQGIVPYSSYTVYIVYMLHFINAQWFFFNRNLHVTLFARFCNPEVIDTREDFTSWNQYYIHLEPQICQGHLDARLKPTDLKKLVRQTVWGWRCQTRLQYLKEMWCLGIMLTGMFNPFESCKQCLPCWGCICWSGCTHRGCEVWTAGRLSQLQDGKQRGPSEGK